MPSRELHINIDKAYPPEQRERDIRRAIDGSLAALLIGRCEGCGEYVTPDAEGGHEAVGTGPDGDPEPQHCGPVRILSAADVAAIARERDEALEAAREQGQGQDASEQRVRDLEALIREAIPFIGWTAHVPDLLERMRMEAGDAD